MSKSKSIGSIKNEKLKIKNEKIEPKTCGSEKDEKSLAILRRMNKIWQSARNPVDKVEMPDENPT
jgi:hypothetical protein